MSALTQKAGMTRPGFNVRFGSKADIAASPSDVRWVAISKMKKEAAR
jgi:hypothetical protein